MPSNIIRTRCLIGFLQGLILYLLYSSLNAKIWPSTQPVLFEPILLIGLFIPIILTLSFSELRKKVMGVWTGVATLVLFGFGYYNVWSIWPHFTFSPPFTLLFFTGIVFFIGQALIVSADKDRKLIANYPTYFDTAWKIVIQIALSLLFLGGFWMLLWIGAGLFHLIQLEFLSKLIQKSWFGIPSTTLVFSLGLHITDIKITLVRGLRTIILALLSWLLPLLTVLIIAFLLSLFWTGLTPLWQLEYTSYLLCGTTAILIVLINSAYQDGKLIPRFLFIASSVATIILLPLIVLAMYALSREVSQHSWTVSYILLAALELICSFYALGYIFCCWRLKALETWNYYAALFTILVLTLLLTPIADPMRLSVISQINGLKSGHIPVEKFNFEFLRWDSGRYGYRALHELQTSSQDPKLLQQVAYVLEKKSRYEQQRLQSVMIVHTADGKLPASFTQQNWKTDAYADNVPSCVAYGTQTCEAWLKTFQNKRSVLILENSSMSVFQETSANKWQYVGQYQWPETCTQMIEQIHQGLFNFVPPVQPFPDLEANGQHIYFNPINSKPCPNKNQSEPRL